MPRPTVDAYHGIPRAGRAVDRLVAAVSADAPVRVRRRDPGYRRMMITVMSVVVVLSLIGFLFLD
jgi:hypothetical protein